jgi:hypothetical protein
MKKPAKTVNETSKPASRKIARKTVPATSTMRSADEIARRAYELFLQQGAQHGRDLEHWLTAERELGAS